MRYKKEKINIQYAIIYVFPIIFGRKCKFCDHFFVRELGFKVDSISINPRVYNIESLKNVYICKVCAKTKRDAVNLFNSNLDKFELFMKQPLPRFKESITESEYVLQGYRPTKSEIINPVPPKAP